MKKRRKSMNTMKVVLLMAVIMTAFVTGSFAQEKSSAGPKVLSDGKDANNAFRQYAPGAFHRDLSRLPRPKDRENGRPLLQYHVYF